ncbi:uncharacterized protein LOC110420482 isoform X2 [Herrania umbratica]|uniref:Uncharacterized protein LOC110420482 isoform X2 n=1 Tax=Herrania umbratica TaxID=108875 RepID=A0A6J1ASN2_9ROSI|nr:uncharacterized protein LOC110420482 isoform X2 [Herrania umbratica]
MALQGSSFCYNVNVNCMPCSSTNSFRSLHCFYPSPPKRCHVVLARTSTGNGTEFFAGQCLSKLPSGRPRDDLEGTLSGESIIMDEQTLQRDLQNAIEEENYAQAARIRDDLRVLHEDSKASVLAANSRFYDAFRRGDLAAMQNLWAKGDDVCCVHPGANGISGYDYVMGSWEVVWMNYEFPLEIELKNVQVHVKGDVGYVTCMEFVKTKGSSWGGQFVTNVFEKINGQWCICIHHASLVDL